MHYINYTHNIDYGAKLNTVLQLAGFENSYNHFLLLAKRADLLFQQGDFRAAYNVLNLMWMDPHIVPTLLLIECFYARRLILPTWKETCPFDIQQLSKKGGGTRPVIIPKDTTRICMGVINSMLQTTCNSWDERSFGFRPNNGTQSAIEALAFAAKPIIQKHSCAFILMFDIKKAFNSVHFKRLSDTLDFHFLPHDIKAYIWSWQHNQTVKLNTTGLVQGFSYSPTLFAWYIDTIFVKHTNFISYADNFAGVFATQAEAHQALLDAQARLQAVGLYVHPNSVIHCAVQAHLPQFSLPWLGHALDLPSCNCVLHKFEVRGRCAAPTFITAQEWEHMLQRSGWVDKVRKIEWRSFKA